MRIISIPVLIGLIGLLVVPQSGLLVPMNSGSGSFPIEVSGVSVTSFEVDSGRVVVVQFSAERTTLEFFIVHSDYFQQGGLPAVSSCQYHIIAQSASYQFTTDCSGTWYLVFANSQGAQTVTYEWIDYPPEEWITLQFNNWFLIVSCIGVASIVITRFARKRRVEKSVVLE